MKLNSILATLPSLSEGQLKVLLAASRAILDNRVVQRSPSTRSKTRAKKVGNGGKVNKSKPRPKGPRQKTSEFAGNPQYEKFKTLDRAVRLILKKYKTTLKVASSEHDSPLDIEEKATLRAFENARSCWFREKAKLTTPGTAEETFSKAEAPPAQV